MITTSKTVTRSARPNDLSKLANLIHFEAYVHRHLDYRPPLDWVGQEPFLVLEEANRIEAALACPADPPSVAWVRLFAASMQISSSRAWGILWEECLAQLAQDQRIKYVAAIPLYSWFESILKKSDFQRTHSIVMLSHDTNGMPEEAPNPEVLVRPMNLDDLDQVEEIDRASFSPVWVNSRNYLEIAFRQSVVATVAEVDGRLVGYQISTGTPIGGHLARLAVIPELQGRRIGYTILHDLIKQFTRRGARTITVNTQKNNLASLSLYRRMGFVLTGEEYPIYQLLRGMALDEPF